jgi:hypothetical protein
MEASEFLRPGAPNLTLRSLEFRAETHNASPSQEFPSCGAAAVACASLPPLSFPRKRKVRFAVSLPSWPGLARPSTISTGARPSNRGCPAQGRA